ncbi:type VI secretion system TssO [Ascidiimonas sp. W6]|uniref:type VI secretion system TssO n=1 Tax=Ascidiimonas meishanensis TaxID=3128903 RepID=UPI0030EBF929
MKPKNNKERRISILKFALLFLFTTALIVVSFFFDFNKVPLKENKVLRDRSEVIEKEAEFQREFSEEMVKINSLLDSLDTPGQNDQYINALINSGIVDLEKSIPKEGSSDRYDMYKNIIKSYVQLHQFKNKLKEYEDIDQQLDEYEEELERVNTELETAKRNLDAMRIR